MGMSDDDAKVHDALKKLERGLKNMKPSNVLLVGDIMMDCYIHGFANNLNSRAPVPVLKEISRDVDVGAARMLNFQLEDQQWLGESYNLLATSSHGCPVHPPHLGIINIYEDCKAILQRED